MNNKAFQPNWFSVPGETIADLLNEKQISVNSFAQMMEATTDFVNNLIKGYISITDEIAKKLEKIFGNSAEFWLAREQQYKISRSKIWINGLPIKDMLNYGWIKDSKEVVDECLDFFDVNNIDTWESHYNKELTATSFRTSLSFKSQFGAVSAWLRQGEKQSEFISCKPWNSQLFKTNHTELRKLSRKKKPKDFLPEIIRICADCGVAVAIVPTPTACKASGASKFILPNKALIILSFRYLTDDQFWFTLFHEAGHLLLHEKKITFIDVFQEESLISKEEKEANNFAANILIPENYKNALQKVPLNKRGIINFAMEVGVSSGIVVGQLQKIGRIEYSRFNYYKRHYKWDDIIS